MNKPWPAHYRVTCEISEDGLYRHSLKIDWNIKSGTFMGLVMLNPSKASHLITDPTAVRGVAFAQREGFDGLWIGNPYGFRATDPKDLFKANDPVGPRNEEALSELLQGCSKVVVGWGMKLGMNPTRQKFLLEADRLGVDLWCLGKTKSGEPRHPLYLRSDADLILWRKANGES